MDGAFFLVTHSEFNGAMGKGAETSYMGYDGNDKMYMKVRVYGDTAVAIYTETRRRTH